MEIGSSSEPKSVPMVEMICRFCLTRENLSSISSDDYLKIMICPTINQYDDEDLPGQICTDCRLWIQYSYQFHRMCKKANKLLAQYQFTGVLPEPLEKPCLPTNKKTMEAPKSAMSTASQTYEGEIQNVEYSVLSDICISNDGVEELPSSDNISLDEASQAGNDEQKDEPMFSEASILYETCEADDTLILEEDEEIKTEDTIENVTERFDCDFCGQTFRLRQLRDLHLKEHNRVRKFECEKCRRRFYTKKDLMQHETVHTGEKRYKCGLCGKSYTRKASLDRHETIHGEVPKYLCIYCDKSFPSRLILEDHMKLHDSAPKFTCNVCYKSFGFRKNLIRHSAIHQQIFPCEYCAEGFGTQKKLASHLLKHSASDGTTVVYYCVKCEKSFPTSKKFNHHMHIHNAKSEKTLNCFYCNSNFKNREEYVKHTAIHTKDTLICTLCMMQFQDVQDVDAEVDEHIKLHINGELFSCEFCNFLCLTETELSLHTC